MRSPSSHAANVGIVGRNRKGYGHLMLTVVIVCGPETDPLVPTFAALVGGSVGGLVADVLVCHSEPEAIERICEPTGATPLRAADLPDALRDARGAWVMVLEAGAAPLGEWVPIVAAHLGGATARPARFEVAGGDEPFWRRLVGRAHRPLRAGYLMERDAAISALATATPARLPVGRAAVTLAARLRPAG